MMKSLIFIDNEELKSSIDLLEVIRQIGSETGESYGLCINNKTLMTNRAFDKLIMVECPSIEKDAKSIADIIEELQLIYKFDHIVIPATHLGRMLAPRVAMRLHVGLVADVTAIKSDQGQLEMIRPAFSGKIMAGIVQMGNGPTMMSVRPNVFSYEGEANKTTKIIDYVPKRAVESDLILLEEEKKQDSYDIRDSQVLISGGGGVHKKFGKLEQLATALNGQVSASRKIIDKGLAPRTIQVGQSGRTVTPKLYIALGISGAIQHIEGLRNVECIISVNTNANAPICSLSDIVVEGDAEVFIDRLVEKINREN